MLDWMGLLEALIVSAPGLLAWRDAHRAHVVAKETKEEVTKVVGLVNGQQSVLNDVALKAIERAGSAEGALAESHRTKENDK